MKSFFLFFLMVPFKKKKKKEKKKNVINIFINISILYNNNKIY